MVGELPPVAVWISNVVLVLLNIRRSNCGKPSFGQSSHPVSNVSDSDLERDKEEDSCSLVICIAFTVSARDRSGRPCDIPHSEWITVPLTRICVHYGRYEIFGTEQ